MIAGLLAAIFVLALFAGYLIGEGRRARATAVAEASRLQAEIEAERAYTRRVLDEKDAALLAAADAARRERKELYQRIQAPEIAVHETQLEARRERPYVRREPVGADNDAAFAARRAAAPKEEATS